MKIKKSILLTLMVISGIHSLDGAAIFYHDEQTFLATQSGWKLESFEEAAINLQFVDLVSGLVDMEFSSEFNMLAVERLPLATDGFQYLLSGGFNLRPMDISFTTPVTAIGFTIIDSGDNGTGPLRITASVGDAGFATTHPDSDDDDGNFRFIGLVSSEPITSIEIFGQGDDDYIIDEIYYQTVPEPSASLLLLLGAAGMAFNRRRSRFNRGCL